MLAKLHNLHSLQAHNVLDKPLGRTLNGARCLIRLYFGAISRLNKFGCDKVIWVLTLDTSRHMTQLYTIVTKQY